MRIVKASQQQSSYLAKVASGKKVDQIAKEEHVSSPTVRYQLSGLKNSMNASTLPELVAKGVQLNIIKPDGEGGFIPSNPGKPDPRRENG